MIVIVIAVVAWVIVAGIFSNKVVDLERRIRAAEGEVKELREKNNTLAVVVGEHEVWKDRITKFSKDHSTVTHGRRAR